MPEVKMEPTSKPGSKIVFEESVVKTPSKPRDSDEAELRLQERSAANAARSNAPTTKVKFVLETPAAAPFRATSIADVTAKHDLNEEDVEYLHALDVNKDGQVDMEEVGPRPFEHIDTQSEGVQKFHFGLFEAHQKKLFNKSAKYMRCATASRLIATILLLGGFLAWTFLGSVLLPLPNTVQYETFNCTCNQPNAPNLLVLRAGLEGAADTWKEVLGDKSVRRIDFELEDFKISWFLSKIFYSINLVWMHAFSLGTIKMKTIKVTIIGNCSWGIEVMAAMMIKEVYKIGDPSFFHQNNTFEGGQRWTVRACTIGSNLHTQCAIINPQLQTATILFVSLCCVAAVLIVAFATYSGYLFFYKKWKKGAPELGYIAVVVWFVRVWFGVLFLFVCVIM